jgi:DNA-directed RNA polymerase specialized sigma subunit
MNQLPFIQIAQAMDLTKGRVSQLHASGLALLRVALKAVNACDVAW